jgi:hypothetical protein
MHSLNISMRLILVKVDRGDYAVLQGVSFCPMFAKTFCTNRADTVHPTMPSEPSVSYQVSSLDHVSTSR